MGTAISGQMTPPVLHDFRIIRPRYSDPHEETFTWLPAAHAQADVIRGLPDATERYRKILRRVGCSSEQIRERGHELADFNHQNWAEMRVFRLHERAQGVGMEERTRIFGEAAGSVFERFYERDTAAPDDLIHVTCTGYLSPSPAQRLVAAKGWGASTLVTHAYHMGCYGAFPAIRQARGFLAADAAKSRVDVVHTEICGLHLNPADHALETFVVQTLFADGFARYSVSPGLPSSGGAGFEILALRETMIPGTEDAMTWMCGDWGMKMTLSKDVPGIVGRHLAAFIQDLLKPAGMDLEALRSEARFAIHPGGPKILDEVETALALRPEQIAASREVLRSYGNMSSATLPHIWERILSDESVPPGAPVLSLAFGPGLTLCGALLRKVTA